MRRYKQTLLEIASDTEDKFNNCQAIFNKLYMTVNQFLSSIRLWFGGIKSVKTANTIITWILEYALTGI